MIAALGKNLLGQFIDWRARNRRERESLFNDWLFNNELQERWRVRVFHWLTLTFSLFGVVNGLATLQIYLDYPEYQNWQLFLLLAVCIPWIILNLVVRWLARRGNSQAALYLIIFTFYIGPPGLASLGIEGFSRYYNSSLLVLSILTISLLSQPRFRQFLIAVDVIAWSGMVILKYILSQNSVTVWMPAFISSIEPGTVGSGIIFYLILILQFYRLSVPNKILLSVLTMIQIIGLFVLGYREDSLTVFLSQTQVADYMRDLQFILDFLTGCAALVTLVFTQVISRPLTQLMEIALKVREGNLNVRAPISSIDEIGELRKVFNQMTARLSEILGGLEETVAARTRDLEVVIGVSKQITQMLRLDELLPRLVEDTRAGFDLYFVSVYLYDITNRQLVLSAGTGDAGQRMKRDRRAFSVETHPSIVAQAARERRAIVIGDISQMQTYFANLYLPDTRSEAAIPMVVQQELLGVLGVQSRQVNDFQTPDIRILISLAEQVAVAVKNARLYQEQLGVAEELKRVDQMKTQFLSSMSHELRTPLNAIINFVEMIARGMIGPVNADQEELLSQTLDSSKHLLHLINDVLDISKIQAGRLTLFLEEGVNLYEEMEGVMSIVSGLAQEKGLQLVRDIDPNLPSITCDRRRVRQVLLNLLGNAIKFTEQGTVTLNAKKRNGEVLFVVIDTGPGISAAEQELIFEPFLQGTDGEKDIQGTGLGLPISRSLVRTHGGELWVESEPGEGAAFFFTLPIREKRRSG